MLPPTPEQYGQVRPAEYGQVPQAPTEHLPGRNEQVEQRLGHTVETVANPAVQMPVLPMPQPVTTDDSTASQPAATDDTPLVAGDDDLIEKEWVDKAKKVIADTRDDPHRRELEVKKLQVDYVRKRYGREIGATTDAEF